MIVATAGHIDHGKTTLVKALTGVDTDRLPQEKARGISIDLGFAYWRAPAGEVVGFVDVPGHERFVHNMLAGVGAVDCVLLVVAADDGVMPQTREHLHIVDLLGVRRCFVVLTKADRVDAARLQQVGRDVQALLAGTVLEAAPLLLASAVSGAGMPAVKAALAEAAGHCRRESVSGRRLRYTVDRAFTVAGSGTVVTGTVIDGAVGAGDRLLLSPGGHEVRVRGIQKDGASAGRAQAGERCALNLAGIDLAHVHRGDCVLDAQLHAPTSRFDVQVRVLADEKHPLRHWTPVHVHLGTRAIAGRIALRRGEAIEAGATGFARILTDRPIAALHGDRFILRDQSARRTLAGGSVLDAFPSERRLPVAVRDLQLQAQALTSPHERLQALASCSAAGVDAAGFARNSNLDTEGLAAVLKRSGLVALGTGRQVMVVTRQRAEALAARRAPAAIDENPEHTRLWQLAQPALRHAGRAGLTVTLLAEATHAKEAVLLDMLHRRARLGETVRVRENRFYLRCTIDEFIEVARGAAAQAPDGRFTAARFRDDAGVGRTLAIQVLETLDRMGVTQRVADARMLRAAAAQPSPTH
jgi:selenocysteine-specific elongation factor